MLPHVVGGNLNSLFFYVCHIPCCWGCVGAMFQVLAGVADLCLYNLEFWKARTFLSYAIAMPCHATKGVCMLVVCPSVPLPPSLKLSEY